MSLEDLRDQYKGLCQSNDNKLKLNGATYRRLRHEMMAKSGNTIVVENASGVYRGELDELNDKYDLAFSSSHRKLALSLNKKKRWELRKELTQQMDSLAADNVNVCLYETRNRNEKKSNCIAVHKTKGQPVQIKKTFGNLDSIIKTEQLQEIAKQKAREKDESEEVQPARVPKKNRKCSKPGLNSKSKSNAYKSELIVIDVDKSEDDDDDDEQRAAHVRYQIEYAPQTDILKYDVRKFVKDKKVGQSTRAPRKFARYGNEYECESGDVSELDEDVEEEEEEVESKAQHQRAESRVNVDLDELIDQQLIRSVEKKSLEEMKARTAQIDLEQRDAPEDYVVVVDRKDRKVCDYYY